MLPITVFVFMELATQPFVMEEKGQLNSFYLAMPVKRSDIVKGRYAFAIFVLAFSLLVGSAWVLLWDGFFAGLLPFIPRMPITFSGFVTMLSLSYFFGAVYILIVLPILFKIGTAKGKYLAYAIMIFMMFSIMILATHELTREAFGRQAWLLTRLLAFFADNALYANLGAFVLGSAFLFLSCMISIGVYRNREF